MAINDFLFNNEILQQIELNKYLESESEELTNFLAENENDILKKSADEYNDLIERREQIQINDLKSIIDNIKKDIVKNDDEFFKKVNKKSTNVGKQEFKRLKQSLKDGVPFPIKLITPSEAILTSSIFSKPFQGKVFKKWAEKFTKRKLKEFEKIMRISFFQGEGQDELSRRLLLDKGGVLNFTRNNAKTLSRSALSHSAKRAKDLFHKENEFIKKFRYTAVLDLRTTFICASRDGIVYKERERPDLDAHFNCRSIYVAVADGEVILTERNTTITHTTRQKLNDEIRNTAQKRYNNANKDKFTSLSKGRQKQLFNREKKSWIAKNVGTTPFKTNFQQWFNKIPDSNKKRYLGENRYKLFKTGKLNIKDLVKPRSGEVYNLKTLKKRNPEATKIAKLM